MALKVKTKTITDAIQRTTQPATAPGEAQTAQKISPRGKMFMAKIEASRRLRDKMKKDWKENVSYRVGQPLAVAPRTDHVTVPVDWSRTKNKQAQLYFQNPEIKAKARDPQWTKAAPLAAAVLNFKMEKELKFYKTMDQVLADVVNAAGFGVVMIGYEGQFEESTIPARDTALMSPEEAAAAAQETETVPDEIYSCYYATRISPAAFLWPAELTVNDFEQADWLGYDGRAPFAQAVRDGWVDENYDAGDSDNTDTVDENNEDKDHQFTGKFVKFTRIFYKMSAFDPKEKDPRKIGQMVFVEGKREPVKDEPLAWQRYDKVSRQWLGLRSLPIKVLTLTTVSDEATPPSDSRIGRPQVKELNRSRTQMLQQRDRSQPLRWFDVNAVDDEIVEQMRKGVYQDMIPMNGPGDHAIGEVARAAYPRESTAIMQVIEHDLDQAWSSGPNQNALEAPGEQSATEAKIINTAFTVQQRYEQAKVLRFFLEVAEGIFNLIQMFQTVQEFVPVLGPNRAAELQPFTKASIPGDYLFECKPDGAVAIDIGQERQEKLGAYKLFRRDPLINPQPLVADVLETFGYDPTEMIAPPQPAPEPQGNFRFSFKGEDMLNPVALAIVLKGSAKIVPNDIEAAKQLLADVGFPVVGAMPAHSVSGTPALPAGPPQPGAPVGPPQAAGPANPGHPGPTGEVTPLNRRYEMNGQTDANKAG